ncbi:MAG: Zinc finger Zim17-type [Lasallia pustulata]|uniref:Zinc finger Zim17-type n=1 Tax=Lasallia pustulata TaxID=136370 RepID=A0A5M8PQA9_9LECA|nr:MAG: Zinc finger Zim17-type [Lasallia pustulata]
MLQLISIDRTRSPLWLTRYYIPRNILPTAFKDITSMIDVRIRLRRATHLNDLVLVKRIIKNNPQSLQNPDFADKGNTSLHLAAQLGFLDLVEYLIAAGHEDNGISRNADWDPRSPSRPPPPRRRRRPPRLALRPLHRLEEQTGRGCSNADVAVRLLPAAQHAPQPLPRPQRAPLRRRQRRQHGAALCVGVRAAESDPHAAVRGGQSACAERVQLDAGKL